MIRFILLTIFILPILVGVHAVIAMSEIAGFGGWQAAVAVNTALAAAVFAVVLFKGRKA